MPSHTLLSHDLRGIRIDIEPLLYPDHTKEPRPLVLTTDNREMPPPLGSASRPARAVVSRQVPSAHRATLDEGDPCG